MDTPSAAAAPRPTARTAAALLALLLLTALLAPLPGRAQTYLVPEGSALPAGSRVLERLSVADALLVTSPTAPAGGITAGVGLSFESLGHAAADGTQLDSGVVSTGADQVWATGNRGAGAAVALIDSGVAPIPAVAGALVAELDFTGTGTGDPLGHGTFLASLIAGRGPVAPGVAPEADIVSLKVGYPDGSTDLGTVLRALEWLHGPGRSVGIRIAVLALGLDPAHPAAAILDAATDRLAASDVLVLTAAGNEGPGGLTSPATATRTFSVGAFDDAAQGGAAPTAADFSGTGVDRAGVPQPDALASGVSLTGHVPPDSIIGREHADRRDGTLLRGTGTSMATALAAGVAALASAARPDLGGTALDMALRTDAGVIDAEEAVAAVLEAPAQPGRAVPPGQAKKADDDRVPPGQARRAGDGHVPPGQARQPLRWTNLRWKHVQWTNLRWKDAAYANLRWKGGDWQNLRWKAHEWANLRWKVEEWANLRWKAEEWANLRWKADAWTLWAPR
jgi:serine protease AprX